MPSRSATRAIWQAMPAGSPLAMSGSSGRAMGRICSSTVASSLPAVARRITVAVSVGSSPAMTAAALRIAGELAAERRHATIVTILCDGGGKYLSEEFWDDKE